MNTMYSTMLQLPLFQGLSQEDFTNILGKVKLHFTKHKLGEVVLREGSPCNELIFLLKGKIAMSIAAPDQSFIFTEYISETHLIEPYALFGLHPQYEASYTADSDINLLRIRKEYVVKDLFKYEIFRMNFVNNLSYHVQTLKKQVRQPFPNETNLKIATFILRNSCKAEGEKRLQIKMENLAKHLDDTRLNISKGLNDLQKKELITLRRKEIIVPDIKKIKEWFMKSAPIDANPL